MEVFDRPVIGATIAEDYVIEGPLAEGGMGAVYIALQRSTGRRRALKVMHPQLVRDPKNRERFLAEARVSAGIRSSHIVEIIGAGVDPLSATPWLAMELLDGETLQQRLDRTAVIHPAELAELFAQLGEALGAAHDAGVVHRDLKPENLYLTRDASGHFGWSLKILDFGIAKVVQENRSSATATGQMGTPLYMAPEQAESASRVRAATDVWPLGLIAFRALVGRAYWLAANAESPALAALMKEMLFDPIERPSARAECYGLQAMIPPGFDGWFERCVERDATQRFVHGRVACEVLANVLRHAAGSARVALSPPPTRAEQTPTRTNQGPPTHPAHAAVSGGFEHTPPVFAPQSSAHAQAAQYMQQQPSPLQTSGPARRSAGGTLLGVLLLIAGIIAAIAYGAVLLERRAARALNRAYDESALARVAQVIAPQPLQPLQLQAPTLTVDAGTVAQSAEPLEETQSPFDEDSDEPAAPSQEQPTRRARTHNGAAPTLAGHDFARRRQDDPLCGSSPLSHAWRVDPAYHSVSESDADAQRVGCRASQAETLASVTRQQQVFQTGIFASNPTAARQFAHMARQLEHGAGRHTWCCP
jgi:serine/threonine protein kinase